MPPSNRAKWVTVEYFVQNETRYKSLAHQGRQKSQSPLMVIQGKTDPVIFKSAGNTS